MEIHAYLLVLSCFLASCYSGLIPKRPSLHPQQDFCKADFVIRADVVSGPETEGYYKVFKINITEVFRGVSGLHALDANLTTKLYTPGEMSSEGVTGPYGIKAGVEYLLHGEILKGVGMYTRFTSVRKDWDDVAPQDREKLQYYETGCEERNRFTGVKA
ncbi:Metalloproteinase inhibitor 1 [Stylophora pistillata]|uniref:Metalloproteinase inhibitor 1 n=2 Tax=Stylophora pistillata TaxID=50429 RepID=A0A2B4T113_STYPI|nr:Metalloproteinase inhibitor 1 [Stylophora pistillata]